MNKNDEYYLNHPLTNIVGFIVNLSLIAIVYFLFINSSLISIECNKSVSNKCVFMQEKLFHKTFQQYNLSDIQKMDLKLVETETNINLALYLFTKSSRELEVPYLNSFDVEFNEGKLEFINSFNHFLSDKSQSKFIETFDNRKVPYICGSLLFLFVAWGVVFYIYYFMRKL